VVFRDDSNDAEDLLVVVLKELPFNGILAVLK